MTYQLIQNIPVWGEPDPGAIDRNRQLRPHTGEAAALMADHHLGYAVPIGGVIGYGNKFTRRAWALILRAGTRRCASTRRPRRSASISAASWTIFGPPLSFGIGLKNREEANSPL